MKKVAILGTGNIGTDLLIKLNKLGYHNLAFVGRREDSPNISFAKSLSVITSFEGVEFFNKNNDFDVVFDCTNAFDANHNYTTLKS